MFSFKAIPHSEISFSQIEEIIRIKSIPWKYPFSSQLEWIRQNIKPDDVHCLLKKNGQLIAYSNLVREEITIDDKERLEIFGIGNVCAIEKGKGYGGEIMNFINEFLIINQTPGILFCKDSLINFYSKYSWTLISPDNIIINSQPSHINTMGYNLPSYHQLTYIGRLF